MTEGTENSGGLWQQVVATLTSPTGVPELGIAPLRIQHKALLRSVTHGGDFPGFFLLTTETEIVQTLVKEELKEPIEKVLHSLTGEEIEAVITVATHAEEDTKSQATSPAASSHQQSSMHTGPSGDGVAGPSTHASPSTHGSHASHSPQSAQPNVEPTRATPQVSSSRPDTVPPRPMISTDTSGRTADKLPKGMVRPFETPDQMRHPDSEPSLNPKYTFSTFVIGPQNQFAAAAAVAVAESPARSYNPLFISGGSGLGKTHLLHAIGHYTRRLYPNMRVRYVSSEEFTNDFINSVRDNAQEEFKRRYRDLDMLIIDDIQFLEGKESTQEEFFHTFNALHQSNRQIVLSSDRPPRELKTLEDRLRTRFEWGLNPDLQFPDLETRIAILSKKVQLEDLDAPDDVLQYIAEHTSSSIRELEGRLLQVTAQASLLKVPVTLSLAEEILGADDIEVEITPDIIITTTADYFDLSVADILGKTKTRPVAHARQIAMYLTRSLTELSLPGIGKAFGNRDHSTVLHACRKIDGEIVDKKPSKDQINDLTTRIRDRARGMN